MARKKTVEKKSVRQGDIHQEIRGLGVLIERVDDKVSLVAEQYGDVKKTLDEHTKILNTHTEMIGNIMTDISAIKENAEIMKTDIEFIKGGLKKKVDAEEFSALERRVALLERRTR